MIFEYFDTFLSSNQTHPAKYLYQMFCKKKIKESTRHFFLLQHLLRFLHCLSFTLKAGGRATVEGRGFPLPPSSWLFPAFRYQVADASREQCETARLQLDSRWCTWGLEHFWFGDHGNSENVGRKLRQPPKIQLLGHHPTFFGFFLFVLDIIKVREAWYFQMFQCRHGCFANCESTFF